VQPYVIGGLGFAAAVFALLWLLERSKRGRAQDARKRADEKAVERLREAQDLAERFTASEEASHEEIARLEAVVRGLRVATKACENDAMALGRAGVDVPAVRDSMLDRFSRMFEVSAPAPAPAGGGGAAGAVPAGPAAGPAAGGGGS
jgi:hypothetical protein